MTTEADAVRVGTRALGVSPGPARRALDVLAAGLALLLASPLMLLIWLAVRATSRGPGLYRQVRVGQGGRPFTLLKFRSMRTGTSGPEVTAAADPRITAVGRLVRRSGLDELPQLWNVLTGSMTLVGPRPETSALARRYGPDSRWVFAHRPGLTGPGQVYARDRDILPPGVTADETVYLLRVVPVRVEMDGRFLRRPTLPRTLALLVDTACYVLHLRTPFRRYFVGEADLNP